MTALLSFMQSQFELIAINVSAGTTAGEVASICQSAARSIAMQITNVKYISMEDVAALVPLIMDSHLDLTSKNSLCSAVVVKSSMEPPVAGPVRWQDVFHFDSYMTAQHWADVEAQNEDRVLHATAALAVAIGIHKPSEKAMGRISRIALLDLGDEYATQANMTSDNCLRVLDKWKASYRIALRGRKQMMCDTSAIPTDFPSDINAFKMAFPNWHTSAYGMSPPVPSKLSVAMKQALAINAHVRNPKGRKVERLLSPGLLAQARPLLRMLTQVQEKSMQASSEIGAIDIFEKPRPTKLPSFCIADGGSQQLAYQHPQLPAALEGSQQLAYQHHKLPAALVPIADAPAVVSHTDAADSVATMMTEMKMQLKGDVEAAGGTKRKRVRKDRKSKTAANGKKTTGKKNAAKDDDNSDGSSSEDESDGDSNHIGAVVPVKGAKKRLTPETGKKGGVPPHPANKKTLEFPGVKSKSGPKYYGYSTIYTDMLKRSWRLKLYPGDRHEAYFKFGRDGWRALVDKIQRVNK